MADLIQRRWVFIVIVVVVVTVFRIVLVVLVGGEFGEFKLKKIDAETRKSKSASGSPVVGYFQ